MLPATLCRAVAEESGTPERKRLILSPHTRKCWISSVRPSAAPRALLASGVNGAGVPRPRPSQFFFTFYHTAFPRQSAGCGPGRVTDVKGFTSLKARSGGRQHPGDVIAARHSHSLKIYVHTDHGGGRVTAGPRQGRLSRPPTPPPRPHHSDPEPPSETDHKIKSACTGPPRQDSARRAQTHVRRATDVSSSVGHSSSVRSVLPD